MRKLIIIGAGGHGRVVADIARLKGYEKIVFLDDNEYLTYCGKYEVVGSTSDIDRIEGKVFIGIGDHKKRKNFCEKYMDRLVTLIHPDAVIGENVEIGTGSVVMAGVVINSDSKVGVGCIINTSSSIDHNCVIGDFVHISVGVHLSGNVLIGNGVWVGVGAVVSNNLTICENCMIGAGTVIVKNISESGTYIGVPARELSRVGK